MFPLQLCMCTFQPCSRNIKFYIKFLIYSFVHFNLLLKSVSFGILSILPLTVPQLCDLHDTMPHTIAYQLLP